MDKKYVKDYWRKVRKLALEEAMSKSGASLLLYSGLILVMFVAIVSGFLYAVGIIQYPFFRDNLVANNITGFAQIIAAIVLVSIFYDKAWNEIPPKLHYDQEELIGDFKEKWGLNKVKTSGIYLYPSEESIDHRAVLSIKNKESVDLNRCYGHAIKVMVGSGEHWENRTHTANSGGELLTWFIHGDAVEWTIKRDTSELLCVAYRHDNGNIGFTHHGKANTVNKDNPKASIYIEIQIDGYMNEKPIEPIYFKGFIRQNDNDIYLEEGELL